MDRCPKRNPGWRLKDVAGVWLGDRMILERAGEHGGNARWRWRCMRSRRGRPRRSAAGQGRVAVQSEPMRATAGGGNLGILEAAVNAQGGRGVPRRRMPRARQGSPRSAYRYQYLPLGRRAV